ncbi:hypothetical protein [Rhizomonospora bruguierae]|uniref:hypothetical protein n=1 Tax=Rhizomonospora bruguierae TaxID=1581705 RepID=UPI0020C14EA5|nr:hypothetical protein [Micromonospora sp. NBRC 107566]
MPSWLRTRNFGISSTTPGTASTAMTAENTPARPRNRSRASAYPAIESSSTRPAVTSTVTSSELPSQSGKLVLANRRVNECVSMGEGIGESGFAAASGSLLSALASWMTNGYRNTSAKNTRIAYPTNRLTVLLIGPPSAPAAATVAARSSR